MGIVPDSGPPWRYISDGWLRYSGKKASTAVPGRGRRALSFATERQGSQLADNRVDEN